MINGAINTIYLTLKHSLGSIGNPMRMKKRNKNITSAYSY